MGPHRTANLIPTWSLGSLLCLLVGLSGAEARTSAEILDASSDSDWRQAAPANLLYVELPTGTVVFELNPTFAPKHVTNIRHLVAAGYYGGSSVVRSQDNYVAQWANTADPEPSLGEAVEALALEFYVPADALAATPVSDRDAYAATVSIVDGFPVASDGENAWLTHCYGMLGVARGAPDSGNGTSLYVVNGHAPRHLDRNGTLVGRALVGMEHLSVLPRGTGPLGFYEEPQQPVPLRSVRLGSDLEAAERLDIQVLRTDTPLFREYLAARRTRTEDWFAHATGAIGVCNVPVPTRINAGPE
ncbi:MAG: peptidylprolyl isomerase [Pseudomonadota bacterium]